MLNFPLEYFTGGDSSPLFLNPSFNYDIFVWNDSSLLGGVANKCIYFCYLIYTGILDILVRIFGDLWGQYIYNGLFFVFLFLIFFHGISYFLKDKKNAVLIT
ncbi:hypothetical protein KGV52_01155, partial [Candidatus Gracilibacteria bacterium]|nr:hypothetical protein [Candidatus Gracilibacteria bacterium]